MRAGPAPRANRGRSSAAFGLALALSGTLAVCGVKAPPRPPLEEPPADAGAASPPADAGADAGAAGPDAGPGPGTSGLDAGPAPDGGGR